MTTAFLIPVLWLVWVLAFPGFKTPRRAQRNPLVWWYPTEHRRGNNPASERLHEGGGFRFCGLLALIPMIGLAASGVPLIVQIFLSLLSLLLVFLVTRLWIDVAEHGAEVMHAEALGIEGYREAEIERMRLTDDYREKSVQAVSKAIDGAAWRSRIILALGGW